ncbi:MAG: hypothetical protein M0Q49_01905 [Porticoccaceae bacterium]|nr:hypothetical protein [Porticoccaceae bacterium]
MMKLFAILFALAVAAEFALADDGAVRLQRRDEIEHQQGVQNRVDELTYTVGQSGDTATLRIGTAEAGTLIASDPYAVRFAPTRQLVESEFYIVLGEGVESLPGRSMEFFPNAGSDIYTNITRRAWVRPIDPAFRLSSATADFSAVSGTFRINRATDEGIELTARNFPSQSSDMQNNTPRVSCSNIVVWAYATNERTSVLDLRTQHLSIIDSIGEIDLYGLRDWIQQRYDPQTADHWSEHPATQTIKTARQEVWLDNHGTLRLAWLGDDLVLLSMGWPLLRITQGAAGGAAVDGFDIVALTEAGGDVLIDVAAGPWEAVSVQQSPTLRPATWTTSAGQQSNYPATITVDGRTCHRVRFPRPAGSDTMFFRVVGNLAQTRNRMALGYGDTVIENSATLIIDPQAAPATSTAPGKTGEVRITDTHLYRCIAPDTWRRITLEAW